MTANGLINWRVKTYQEGAHVWGGPYWYGAITGVSSYNNESIDVAWCDRRTVVSGANDDIDLYNLTDGLGEYINIDGIVSIIIASSSSNQSTLTISGDALPTIMGGTNPTIGPICPGGVVVLDNRITNTLTGQTLRISNSVAFAATYDIVILATGGGVFFDDLGRALSLFVDDLGRRLSLFVDDLGRRL